MTATSYTDAVAHKVAIQSGRKEPPVFLEPHPDPVGAAIFAVDSAVMDLVSLAADYDKRRAMAQDKWKLRSSLAGLQLICSVLESA